MLNASFTLDPAAQIAPVNPRLFGSFVEHMGRCVYTGIFEPDHPRADKNGFREDVLELVRELGVTVVRYPGGNFVSGYRWEDGVGPADQRPRRADLAWHSIETNQFGLDEFMLWCKRAGVEPMLAVNLGTRGVAEALDLFEYANLTGGTRMSDLRIANGTKEPHDIRLWCLGNEMDGPWQVGHKTAREYGRLAAETARALRRAGSGLELVACGSSGADMPTFGSWEREVLDETYDLVDLISCHAYYQPDPDDPASYLASARQMDQFIDSVVSTADAVGARLRSSKRIGISFDEWNVWDMSAYNALPEPVDWPVAPRLIEDTYTVRDAAVVGGLLISLLRHSDRVSVACLAQLANVIGPIRTEPGGAAWRQTIFHPFALTARLARGAVLRVEPQAATCETARYGDVTVIDAAATHDPETGATAVFVLNRSTTQDVTVDVDVRATGARRLAEAVTVWDEDPDAANTEDDPGRVTPAPALEAALNAGRLTVRVQPGSWTALQLESQTTPASNGK